MGGRGPQAAGAWGWAPSLGMNGGHAERGNKVFNWEATPTGLLSFQFGWLLLVPGNSCCSPRDSNTRQCECPMFWWCRHSLSRGTSVVVLFRLLLHCSVEMGCTRLGLRLLPRNCCSYLRQCSLVKQPWQGGCGGTPHPWGLSGGWQGSGSTCPCGFTPEGGDKCGSSQRRELLPCALVCV